MRQRVRQMLGRAMAKIGGTVRMGGKVSYI